MMNMIKMKTKMKIMIIDDEYDECYEYEDEHEYEEDGHEQENMITWAYACMSEMCCRVADGKRT